MKESLKGRGVEKTTVDCNQESKRQKIRMLVEKETTKERLGGAFACLFFERLLHSWHWHCCVGARVNTLQLFLSPSR